MPKSLLVLLLLGLLLCAVPAAAQEPCPGGVVAVIFVDNHSIFDADDLAENRPFRWAYRLANTLHMPTRASFVRSELLFEEGDCYDPALLEESERLLRGYPFIALVDVFGLRQSDGSWHVLVDTKDEWTTKLNLRVGVDGGLAFRGASVAETNLLGRGIRIGVFIREREDVRDVGAEIYTPRVLTTRLDLGVSAGKTRIGNFVEQAFVYPFVGEVGRLAGRQVFTRREEFFPYSTGVTAPAEGEITHLLLPVQEERVELTLAARLGSRGNLTTFGIGFSSATLDFPGFPESAEVARAGNFTDRQQAPAELAALAAGHTHHGAATRLNLLVGQRNVVWDQRSGLDALSGLQDIPMGTDFGVTLGRSVAALSPRNDQPDDMYGRVRAFWGVASEQVVLGSAAALESRQVLSDGDSIDGWRDILGEADVLLYLKPAALEAHTFFLRMEGAGGWKLDRPFQLTLGGETGLRGYPEPAFPVSRRVLFTLEDRIDLTWPAPDLLDFGLTLFADAGKGWKGSVPFGVDSGWRGTVGGGLRIGFPAGTQAVWRLDFAFPVGPDATFRDFIFRASMRDLIGLAAGFDTWQLARSRRTTVGEFGGG
jgi:hypothetical protein